MRAHHYDFVDRWVIPAEKTVVEDAIMQHEHWADWWDGLERVDHLSPDVGPGAKFLCVWRGAAWYKLHIEMIITKYEPGKEFRFSAEGDLKGGGKFNYEVVSDHATTIKIDWNVSTNQWWMNMFSWLLRPLFIRNHTRIMEAGERGLRRYITKRGETHG